MDCSLILMSVLKGVGMGLIATAVGYAKNTPIEKFDWKGLLIKLPVGAVVGGIAGYKNIAFDSAYAWALGAGVITLVDMLLKTVLMRIPKVSSWLETSHEPLRPCSPTTSIPQPVQKDEPTHTACTGNPPDSTCVVKDPKSS